MMALRARAGTFLLFVLALPGWLGAGPVDTTTLRGKVMCGYQGWFNAESDGAGRGWFHWTKDGGPPASGKMKVDLWPDMSELGPDERFPTPLTNAAGRRMEVFSSYRRATVLRHFRWMEEAGIDGVFLQRFAVDAFGGAGRRHNDAVLGHCREGAQQSGRAWALMYDLSGLGSNQMARVLEDWRHVRADLKPLEEARYLRHRGRPLVAVWGIGFSDNRRYTLGECRQLVEALKADGCAVMVGVPTYWRELRNDALKDPALHEIIRLADVVSPWTVGRYRNLDEVRRHAERLIGPDQAWCTEAGVDYLPVVFPGFSWFNMHGGPLDAIPRRRGRFLWSQFVAAKTAGADSAYVAMFDEVDEGTAIFKCTSEPPMDPVSKFIGYEGLPSDFYLRLTGMGARLMRGEIEPTPEVPLAR